MPQFLPAQLYPIPCGQGPLVQLFCKVESTRPLAWGTSDWVGVTSDFPSRALSLRQQEAGVFLIDSGHSSAAPFQRIKHFSE